MTNGNHIHYLKRQEVDIAKWDQCIKQSPNGWLYARSFYLDGIGNWEALVEGDYDFIMPLPQKKKYGISYVYFPPFIGQLGIISSKPITEDITNAFLTRVRDTFLVADIQLNEQNPRPSLPSLHIQHRTNYILPLRQQYQELYDRYSADAKKCLRRTYKLELISCTDIPIARVIELYRAAYGKKNLNYSQKDYDTIARTAALCIKNGHGFTLGICDTRGHLHAAAFFGIDNKRIYYLLGAPAPEGRKSNAVHRLIDEVIKKYAGTDLTFDFEGSDIPSVAAFYRKFAPLIIPYDLITVNRLPLWLRRRG